jgi:hypothetical protein
MSVSAEDKVIAGNCRRALAKSNLDISQLQISCAKGVIDLNGTIKAPRGASGELNIRKEFQTLVQTLRNVRGVREVYHDRVRFFE